VLDEIRSLGDSLRSLALVLGFYALRLGARVSDTPAVPEPSPLVPLKLRPTPRN
jgi:hypothetical protein